MPRVLTAVLQGVYAQVVEVEDGAPGTPQGLAAAVARRVRTDVTGVVLYAALDAAGRLLPVRGVVCAVVAAQKRSVPVIVAGLNGPEAAAVPGADVRQADTLEDVLRFLRGTGELARPEPVAHADTLDRLELPGDHRARRALELAAAGSHTLLVVAPEGPEAMRVARAVASALPPLDALEAHEATVIASVCGLLGPCRSGVHRPPLRTPHHTVSREGLLGGERPGEVSLAHAGVLALENLPEYPRGLLPRLWETMASGVAQTVDGSVRARFMVAATMQPCPCGWEGHRRLRCTCSPQSVERRWQRFSTSLPHFDVCVRVEGERHPGANARSPGASGARSGAGGAGQSDSVGARRAERPRPPGARRTLLGNRRRRRSRAADYSQAARSGARAPAGADRGRPCGQRDRGRGACAHVTGAPAVLLIRTRHGGNGPNAPPL